MDFLMWVFWALLTLVVMEVKQPKGDRKIACLVVYWAFAGVAAFTFARDHADDRLSSNVIFVVSVVVFLAVFFALEFIATRWRRARDKTSATKPR